MNKKTEPISTLIILQVRRATGRGESLVFGNDISFLREWFTKNSSNQHVETHTIVQNSDETILVMACSYNLN